MGHITIAASARAFTEIFKAARDNFKLAKSDSANFGPFSASYSLALHLADGTVQLNDDNTVEVQGLDIVFETLKVSVCFDLPGFSIPSFCIVPDPWNGCLVGFPGFSIGGPICAPVDLSGLVSQISDVKANLVARYFVAPARLSTESDLDAEFAGHPNNWRIYIDPVLVKVEPIDIPDTVGNLFENAVRDAINLLFPSWLPNWAKDLIWDAIGPIVDLIKDLLGIAGQINDFFSNLLGNLFGIVAAIETAVADYFANRHPIYTFEDPFPILAGGGGLIPVKIPIRNVGAMVDSKEMTVSADVG